MAHGNGVEETGAAFCPYHGRHVAGCGAPGDGWTASGGALCNGPLPRAPRPPPSCIPASMDTERAVRDSPTPTPNGPQPIRPLPHGRLGEGRIPSRWSRIGGHLHTHSTERMTQAKGAPPSGKRPLDCLWASRLLAVRGYCAAPISSRWVQRPVTEPGKL